MSGFDRSAAKDVVLSSLRELLTQNGDDIPSPFDETVVLVGKESVIDSLGVVSLIVEIEQALETGHDVSVTLASDRAMSERNSPFRSVGVLTDHILTLIEPEQRAA